MDRLQGLDFEAPQRYFVEADATTDLPTFQEYLVTALACLTRGEITTYNEMNPAMRRDTMTSQPTPEDMRRLVPDVAGTWQRHMMDHPVLRTTSAENTCSTPPLAPWTRNFRACSRNWGSRKRAAAVARAFEAIVGGERR